MNKCRHCKAEVVKYNVLCNSCKQSKLIGLSALICAILGIVNIVKVVIK